MSYTNREVTLRFLAQPTDANFGGKVHGGTAMKWLDQAGYACATGWSGQYCVTAFVGNISFHQPISVGYLIEVNAKVVHTGKTSMLISIDLRACDPKHCSLVKALQCVMVFVAVDENGKKIEVPSWVPETEEDILLEKNAMKITQLRNLDLSQKD